MGVLHKSCTSGRLQGGRARRRDRAGGSSPAWKRWAAAGTALFLLSLPLLLAGSGPGPLLPAGQGTAPCPAGMEARAAGAGSEEMAGAGARILRLVGRVLWSLFRLRRGADVRRAALVPVLTGLVDLLLPGDLRIPLVS